MNWVVFLEFLPLRGQIICSCKSELRMTSFISCRVTDLMTALSSRKYLASNFLECRKPTKSKLGKRRTELTVYRLKLDQKIAVFCIFLFSWSEKWRHELIKRRFAQIFFFSKKKIYIYLRRSLCLFKSTCPVFVPVTQWGQSGGFLPCALTWQITPPP